MVMTTRDQHILEAQQTRSHAAAILADLEDAKAQCEATLATEKRSDMFKAVSGQSSLETAIAETRRLIDTLDRQIQAAVEDLDTDDQDLLASDGLEAVVNAGRMAIGGRVAGMRAVG